MQQGIDANRRDEGTDYCRSVHKTDHCKSLLVTKFDLETHKTNVIKPRLRGQPSKTLQDAKSRTPEIAHLLREDTKSSPEKVNYLTRSNKLIEDTHEVHMTELYYDDGTLVIDAAKDICLLMPDTASEKTVGTTYYLDRYEKEVLEPLGLRSVSQLQEEFFRFGPGELKVSRERRAIPVAIGGIPFIISTSVVGPREDDFKPQDENLKRPPWFAGRDLLRELGTNMDIADDSMDFALLGLTRVRLRGSSGGRPAIDITQWPSQGSPRANVNIEQLNTLALLHEVNPCAVGSTEEKYQIVLRSS